MKYKGKIVQWNDEKGYGFVQPIDGSQRVFFHISAFTRGDRRPVNGDFVIYTLASTSQGKMRAERVTYSAKETRKSAKSGVSKVPAIIAVSLIGGLITLAVLEELSAFLPALYGVASLLAFVIYAKDKSAAKQGKWRTPESHLHLINLLGGWPGGLMAQTYLRHKSSKTSFLVVFWITVLVNMLALTCYLEPSLLPEVLQPLLNKYR